MAGKRKEFDFAKQKVAILQELIKLSEKVDSEQRFKTIKSKESKLLEVRAKEFSFWIESGQGEPPSTSGSHQAKLDSVSCDSAAKREESKSFHRKPLLERKLSPSKSEGLTKYFSFALPAKSAAKKPLLETGKDNTLMANPITCATESTNLIKAFELDSWNNSEELTKSLRRQLLPLPTRRP